jgi:hypothetical protein
MGFRMFFDPATTVRRDIAPLDERSANERARRTERNRILTLLRNGPIDLAMSQAWQLRRAGHDKSISRLLPRALAERQVLSRGWVVRPREVFERWAGLDVPSTA